MRCERSDTRSLRTCPYPPAERRHAPSDHVVPYRLGPARRSPGRGLRRRICARCEKLRRELHDEKRHTKPLPPPKRRRPRWVAGCPLADGAFGRMTLVVRAAFCVLAYLGAVLAPLVFAAVGANHPDHGFLTNFSVALGFV